jgi:hypothetical protein
VKPVVDAISGWSDYATSLDVEKKKLEELCSAKNIGADDESNVFKPGQQYASNLLLQVLIKFFKSVKISLYFVLEFIYFLKNLMGTCNICFCLVLYLKF